MKRDTKPETKINRGTKKGHKQVDTNEQRHIYELRHK